MGFFVQAVMMLLVALPTVAPTGSPRHYLFVTPDQLVWKEYREKGWAPGSAIAVVMGDPNKPCGWIIRYRMPDGYFVPVHKNSDAEEATVIGGTYVLGMGTSGHRAQAAEYPVGSYLRIDKGAYHYAWAMDETTLEIRPVCGGK